jgi:hypothetical protein
MVVEAVPTNDARDRLRRSRVEIVQLIREVQGYRPPPAPDFPRSRLMRSLLETRGSGWLAGAGIAVAMLRPRLVWRVLQWALGHPLTQRLLMTWAARKTGIMRR